MLYGRSVGDFVQHGFMLGLVPRPHEALVIVFAFNLNYIYYLYTDKYYKYGQRNFTTGCTSYR